LGHGAVEAGVEGTVVVQAVFAGECAAGCPVVLPVSRVVGAGDAWSISNRTYPALCSVQSSSTLAHCALAAGCGRGAVVVSGALPAGVAGGVEIRVAIAREVTSAAVGDGANCRLVGARHTHRVRLLAAVGGILAGAAHGFGALVAQFSRSVVKRLLRTREVTQTGAHSSRRQRRTLLALVVAGAALCACRHVPAQAAGGATIGGCLARETGEVLGAWVAELVVAPYVKVVPCFALKLTDASIHPYIFSRQWWRIGTVTTFVDWKLPDGSVCSSRAFDGSLLGCAVVIFRTWNACV
jgi:hypothetical protein